MLEARARVLVAGALASAVNKPLAANLRGSLREGPNSDGLWELTPPIQHRLQPHETGGGRRQKLDVAARVERLQHAALGRQAVLDLAKFVSRACFAKSDAVTRASCAKTHEGPFCKTRPPILQTDHRKYESAKQVFVLQTSSLRADSAKRAPSMQTRPFRTQGLTYIVPVQQQCTLCSKSVLQLSLLFYLPASRGHISIVKCVFNT